MKKYPMSIVRGIAVATMILLTSAASSWAATATWNGASWSGGSGTGGIPTSADDVVVAGNLTWNTTSLPATVNSFSQTSGTTTFETTFSGSFSQFNVTNNMSVSNGATVTHRENEDSATWRLNVNVGGNLNVDAGGSISATGKGYDAVNGTAAQAGTGTGSLVPGGDQGAGAAYGGEGRYPSATAGNNNPRTYGSVLNPLDIGSGNGHSPNQLDRSQNGGGLVQLTVGGTSTIDGTLSSNGQGDFNQGGGASGGSINITTGELTGTGTIQANGGEDTNHGGGGGGRLAIRLTNSTAPGGSLQFDALGGIGSGFNSDNGGGAGTIYVETVADAPGAGRVFVANRNQFTASGTGSTTLGSLINSSPEDLSGTSWIVDGRASLKLVNDVTINSLELSDPNAQLLLYDFSLTLFSLTDIDGVPFDTEGIYTDNSNGAFDNVDFGASGQVQILAALAVPEPSSIAIWTLLGMVLAGYGFYRRRRQLAVA